MIIETALAVQCILGEAQCEGPDGMLALAHALKNRGTTQGVYGCQRIPKTPYTPKELKTAKNAWKQAFKTKDPTNGATHWGNNSDMRYFKKCKWFRSAYGFRRIKNHTFFKIRC